MITGDHIRMIRGALRLSLREFADIAGLAFKTVHNLERGAKAQSGTREKIRAAFSPYVQFIEPIEGVSGSGIVMKWGVQPIGDASDSLADDAKGTGEGLNSRAWDDDFESAASATHDPDFPPLPITDEMREELRVMLQTLDISPSGRAVLVRDFGL